MKKYIYLVILLFTFGLTTSCKKKSTQDPEPAVSYSDDLSKGTVYYTLDGESHQFIEYSGNIQGSIGSGKSLNSGSYSTAIYTSGLEDTETEKVKASIAFGELGFIAYDYIPTNSEFKAFIKTGNYNYVLNSVNGVEFYLEDESGKKWSTSLGSAEQTGSSFKIVEVSEGENNFYGDYSINFRAVFNCTLYDGTGLSKTLTDGLYTGTFSNI